MGTIHSLEIALRVIISVILINVITFRQGYNAWRSPWRPSQLLRHLCKEARIQGPTFTTEGVLLGNWDDRDNHLRLDIAAGLFYFIFSFQINLYFLNLNS